MNTRVKFAGDPVPGETGQPGAQPNIPLTPAGGASVEMLPQAGDDDEEEPKKKAPVARGKLPPQNVDDDDDDEEGDEAEPEYARERIAARTGISMEEAKGVEDVERELDEDDVVPCLFPTNMKLQDKGIMHIWAAGSHLVPVALAGDPSDKTVKMHWWLKRNKVRRIGKRMARPE